MKILKDYEFKGYNIFLIRLVPLGDAVQVLIENVNLSQLISERLVRKRRYVSCPISNCVLEAWFVCYQTFRYVTVVLIRLLWEFPYGRTDMRRDNTQKYVSITIIQNVSTPISYLFSLVN